MFIQTGVSRNTIKNYLRILQSKEISIEDALKLEDPELDHLLRSPSKFEAHRHKDFLVRLEYFHEEGNKPHVTSSSLAKILLNEWVIEGRKKWGTSAISLDAQNIRATKGVEKDLIEVVKYNTKGFGRTKNSNESKMMVYAAAYDHIVAAMKRHRVFDRFGFNLPSSKQKQGKKQILKDFKNWGFLESCSDWVDEEGGNTLSNYVPTEKDQMMIKNNINKTLE